MSVVLAWCFYPCRFTALLFWEMARKSYTSHYFFVIYPGLHNMLVLFFAKVLFLINQNVRIDTFFRDIISESTNFCTKPSVN